MMNSVTAVNNEQPLASLLNESPQAPVVEAGNEATKDVFLRLLVAQLENQDPLNPVEGTQYVSQLAEFSTLEQITEIRTGIEASRMAELSNLEQLTQIRSGIDSLLEIFRPVE